MPKYNVRRKAQLELDIREGGIAQPIAPNTYYMIGRSHDDGGIAIGPNNKNGLEVEGGEVVKVGNNDIKVFSSVPLLRGVSPAQLVMGGANPNKVFKAQEDFKDRYHINDDGTTYENGGEKIYTPSKAIQKQIQETGRITIGGAPTVGGLRTYKYIKALTNARKYGNKATNIFRIGKEIIKQGTEKLVESGKISRNIAQVPRSIYGQFIGANGQNLPKTINLFKDNNEEYKMGGLSRSEDYGSKKKPYPSVSKSDFAGSHRSYPIPTKADAVDALRLAGLHGRSDVKAKVYRKYPELRKKAEMGIYQPKRNEKGQVVLDPNNPQDVKWLREQQGKRGAKAVNKGQREFIEGTLDRATPVILGVAAANPITTATSLAGGYLLGKAGEYGGELYKTLTGEDYTREGKVIGQTIGGLAGPIGAKLFGKGATNAWNTYKSNRLNSTQTLVDVPELGLTVRPNIRTTGTKQLGVTNNQKYLPTDVEDLTWKEPKALLETQAQVTRRDLKNFNRWLKLFGYEPVPLKYAETKSIADRHVQDRIRQHNTFLRGVAKPNKLQRQAIEYELAKEGITSPTDYDIYTYMATHSAPTTGAGRADLRPIQVRKHKIGNFNLSKTSDSPIGALYTQGSGRGAAGYAGMGPESGGHRRTGVVVEVARPTYFRPGANYSEWVKENDFNFGNIVSRGFHKKVANRVVETGKVPEDYNLPDENKQIIFNDIKNEFSSRPEPVYQTVKTALDYIKTHRPNILKNITQLDESAFNSLSKDSKRAYNEYLGKLMIGRNPKNISFIDEVKKENKLFNKLYKREIIVQSKQHKNNYLTDVEYNDQDYTQPDYSVIKATTRNKGNAQQHYIFRAPIGEKILEGRGFYMPTEEEIINATTDHYTLWTPGYSRNTRKYGGIKKFKFGGNMIYEINGNVKNGLMSARPKAELGKEKNIKYPYKDENGQYYINNGYKIYSNGQIIDEKGYRKYYVKVDDDKNVLGFALDENGNKKLAPSFNERTSRKVYDYSKNKRPQFYAEKRIGLYGDESLAEKFGLARSGWSFGETPEFDYVPTVDISIPDDYKTVASKETQAEVSSSGVSSPAVTSKLKYGNSTYDVSQLGSPEYKAAKAKLKTPPTESGTQAKDGRWIGQYKATTPGDWIGLGANVLGSIGSYLLTKSAINKMPEPIKPALYQAAKLKTKYNIEPQLSEIREAEQMNRASVRRNTQSSNTSLAREQRLLNEARTSRNQLYGQKENIETQLINQDRLNRQRVAGQNIAAYNDYLNRVYANKVTQNQAKVSNVNNLISGLTGGVNSILGTIESRRATNNTLRAIAAANPNVDARLIGGFDYYIDPITKKKYNKNQQYVGTING